MRMITLQIHAKAESRQCGPLFIMFSGPGRMFHQLEKYDSDFTDVLSGFIAGRQESVRVCWICMSHMFVVKKEGDGREQRKKEKRDERKRRDAVKVAAEV